MTLRILVVLSCRMLPPWRVSLCWDLCWNMILHSSCSLDSFTKTPSITILKLMMSKQFKGKMAKKIKLLKWHHKNTIICFFHRWINSFKEATILWTMSAAVRDAHLIWINKTLLFSCIICYFVDTNVLWKSETLKCSPVTTIDGILALK